jgi:hypothetical protein
MLTAIYIAYDELVVLLFYIFSQHNVVIYFRDNSTSTPRSMNLFRVINMCNYTFSVAIIY